MSALSLSARRAWIEITERPEESRSNMSLSARRAWIEMFSVHEVFANFEVALRKESVDRNLLPLILLTMFIVALRKESVDRNNGKA